MSIVRPKSLKKFINNYQDLNDYIYDLFSSNSGDRRSLIKIKSELFKNNEVRFMQICLKNIHTYIEKISSKDEFIFMPEFGNSKNKPLQFFPKFDFRRVWNIKALTSVNKKIIFRYLELMYIHASSALDTNAEMVQKLVESIKAEQEIAKQAKENPNAFAEADPNNLDFDALFGDDEIIKDLVEDLKENLNIEDTLGEVLSGINLQAGANPLEALQQLGNNTKLQGALSGILEKTKQRMADKNINEEDLLKSFSGLQSRFQNQMSNNPAGREIGRMLGSLNLDKIVSNGGNQNPEDILNNPNLPPEMKKMFSEMMKQQNK